MLTFASFALILQVVLPILQPEAVDQLDAAQARAWRSVHDVNELAELRPSDRCICDHPSGPWEECHAQTDEYADREIEAALRQALAAARTPPSAAP